MPRLTSNGGCVSRFPPSGGALRRLVGQPAHRLSPRCWTRRPSGRRPSAPERFQQPAPHPPLSTHGCRPADLQQDPQRPPAQRDHGPRPHGPPPGGTSAPAPLAPPQQRRRRWIGLLLVLAVLLIAAGIISAIILDRRLSSSPAPQGSSEQTDTTAERPP